METPLSDLIRSFEDWRQRALMAEARNQTLERKLASAEKRNNPFLGDSKRKKESKKWKS